MASSASTTSGGDERPRAPHADACAGTAPPQAHVEWAASMQAYYAAGGQPYAWHAAQQECEELAQKVTDLTVVNGTLRSELDELKKACEDMEAENSQLIGELEQSEAPSVVTTLSIQIDTTKAHHRSSDQHGNKNNTGSNG
nr:bZIP29 [Zea mays]